VALLCGSALIGALLVWPPIQLADWLCAAADPGGIVIALVGCPFFIVLLWRRRDAL
jgi:iron complex transport system permease protein